MLRPLFLALLCAPCFVAADYAEDQARRQQNQDLRLQERNRQLQDQDLRRQERNQDSINQERRIREQNDAEIRRDQLEFDRLNKQGS